MRPVFDSSGDLASIDVLSAFCAVGRGGASGSAEFTIGEGETVRYGFDRGVLVAVETPPENAPAEVLVRAGKIQRATYEALTVGDFEDRFAVAVASGVISRREAAWESRSPPSRHWPASRSPRDVHRSPRAGQNRAAIFRFGQITGSSSSSCARTTDRSCCEDRRHGHPDRPGGRLRGGFAALGLTADADSVVDGIDGVRTVEKVVKHSRADEFATLKLLAALMTLGLIHPILEAPRASAPAPGGPAEPGLEPGLPVEEEAEETVLGNFPRQDDAFRGGEEPPPVHLETNMEDGEATVSLPIGDDDDAVEALAPDLEEEPPRSFPGSLGRAESLENVPPETPAGIRDQASVVNLPLFALTAPEEPSSEPVLDREEHSPEGGATPRRTWPWMIVTIAAAALIAVIFVGRRPGPVAVAPAGTSTPAELPAVVSPRNGRR